MSYHKLFATFASFIICTGSALASEWETPWEISQETNVCIETEVESFYDMKAIQEKIDSNDCAIDLKNPHLFTKEHYDFNEEPKKREHRDHTPYHLRIGDRLNIAIYGEPTTRRPVVVDFTGSISYLLVNSLPAAGHTIDEVRAQLEEKLKAFYRNPILIITAMEVLPDFYTIMGEARRPGKKALVGNATVLSALAEGGGFNNRIFRNQTIDTVDLEHSFLSRKGKMVPVDFVSLVKYGDASQDVRLENGDYIYLASQQLQKVYVLGEVGTAAAIDIFDTITLSQAIALAGGLNWIRASSRVAIIRGSLGCPEYFLVDINRILKGKACDFRLCPNDIVYVPPRKFQALREILFEGIRIFVATLASIAGSAAFVSITPAATNVITPVPIISAGGTSTFIGTGAGTGVILP